MSANDVSTLTATSTRPVSSASFSPSLPKISPRRRWIAHCCPSTSGGTAGDAPSRGMSGATRLDPLAGPGRAVGQTVGLLEDAVLGEDRRLRADGQGDRV